MLKTERELIKAEVNKLLSPHDDCTMCEWYDIYISEEPNCHPDYYCNFVLSLDAYEKIIDNIIKIKGGK